MWFYFDDIEDDQDKIIHFLEDTKEFLGRLVQHGKAFVAELVDSLRAAWRFASQRFDSIIDRIPSPHLQPFVDHGLTGQELKLKLDLVSHYFGELISGGGKQILKKFLSVINNLLDSILQALGIPGAVKEIKDSIRDALQD